RNALFAGAKQVHRLQPKPHRDMAILEYGSDLYGKWLAALVALVNARASALALQLADAINAAAMGADRAIGPYAGFNPRVSCSFVLEGFGFDHRFRHGRRFPFMNQRYQINLGTSSVISRALRDIAHHVPRWYNRRAGG